MNNEMMQRVLPAAAVTLALHGLLLSWKIHQPEALRPKPLPIKKIAVSLYQPPPPPEPQHTITRDLPPPLELPQVKHNPLQPLPPVQQKTVRKLQPPPKLAPVRHKALQPLPPVQQKTVRKLQPPPKLKPARHKALQPLPPVQERIQRIVPSPPKVSSLNVPQPLEKLPPIENVREEVDPYPDIPWEPVVPTTQPVREVVQPVKRVTPVPTTSSRNFQRQPATPPAPTGVVREAAPLYQSNPPPAYPRQARRRGLQGVVTLEVLVNAQGRVADLRLFASSGHRILDKAALKAVRGWRFTPGTVAGQQQQMWVKVPVRFQLQ